MLDTVTADMEQISVDFIFYLFIYFLGRAQPFSHVSLHEESLLAAERNGCPSKVKPR